MTEYKSFKKYVGMKKKLLTNTAEKQITNENLRLQNKHYHEKHTIEQKNIMKQSMRLPTPNYKSKQDKKA